MGLKTTSPGLKKVVKEVAWRPGSPGKGYQAFCSDPRLADLAALGRAVRSPLCTSGGLAPAEGGQDGCCPATLGGREWGGIVLLTVSAGRANPKVKPSGAPGGSRAWAGEAWAPRPEAARRSLDLRARS